MAVLKPEHGDATTDISEVRSIDTFPLHVVLTTAEALLKQRKFETAKKVFFSALKKRPWSIRALYGLGESYNETKNPNQAIEYLKKLIIYRPNHAKGLTIHAHALSLLDNYSAAQKFFLRSLAADPTKRATLIALGVTRLRLGLWSSGFELYDQREGLISLHKSIGTEKVWNGCQDISGKKILVIGEQGFGDHIHFLRYCSLLKERGAFVVFFTRKELRELCSWVPAIDEVITNKDRISFDYAVMAMSLPKIFGTLPDNIPSRSAYIVPPETARSKTRVPKSSRARIVVAWKGNPDNSRDAVRSCPPALFAGLIEKTENASFYALPFDLSSEPNPRLASINALCNPDSDFADVALRLKEVDLVVTVDTSLAHLAGALGVETWLLISNQPDWRWLTAGEDCLWYESIRMFRMETDWDHLIERVTHSLKEFLDQAAVKRQSSGSLSH